MNTFDFDITFIGTALVDSIVRGLDPEPVSATGYRAESGGLYVGGEAVNGSLAAAKLGLRPRILCSLGQDAAGDLVVSALEAGGVDTSAVLGSPDHPTPVSTLLVREDGSRRSITNAAHRYNFHPERYGERFARSRALILADTKLPNFRKLTLEDLRKSLPKIDYIFPNEDEGRYCTGQTDPEAMADVFLDYGVKNVIVKLGAQGCFFKNAREAIRLDAFPIRAVDATGAGDCFLAGFAASLLAGESHETALRFANACGALCTTALGASAGLRDRAQVEELIQKQSL